MQKGIEFLVRKRVFSFDDIPITLGVFFLTDQSLEVFEFSKEV